MRNSLPLTLARLRLEADRREAHRKMRGLDRKAAGIMETPGFGEKQQMILDQYREEIAMKAGERMVASVLRGLARDMGRGG